MHPLASATPVALARANATTPQLKIVFMPHSLHWPPDQFGETSYPFRLQVARNAPRPSLAPATRDPGRQRLSIRHGCVASECCVPSSRRDRAFFVLSYLAQRQPAEAACGEALGMRQADLVVMVRCLHCAHKSILSNEALTRFGIKPDAPIAGFVKRLRCSRCGSGGIMASRVSSNEAAARRLRA